MLTDYYFWFSQPSSFLSNFDKAAGIVFAALFGLGLLLLLGKFLAKNPVAKKLISRFFHLALWVGLSGLFWFGFRYESTPFFARRFWVGVLLIMGLAWLVWILYYLAFKFKPEYQENLSESIKQRYLPKQQK